MSELLDFSALSNPLTPGEPVTSAGRKILYGLFQEFLSRESGTLAGDDIEHLHRMRVSTRRMRTLFRALEDHFDPGKVQPIRDCLKELASLLGELRDIDTFCLLLQDCRSQVSSGVHPAIDHLMETRTQARQRRLLALRDKFARKEYGEFKENFLHFLSDSNEENLPSLPVRSTIPAILESSLIDIFLKRDRVIGAPQESLHRLRIRFKRCRYVCEFFQTCFGDRMQELIQEQVQFQGLLGKMQDLHRDIQFLRGCREEIVAGMPSNRAALDKLTRHLQDDLQEKRLEFFEKWRYFSLEENKQRFLYIIRNDIL